MALHPIFPEWTEVHAGMAVRQGDVISAITNQDDSWRELLIVLTADCDLEWAKHSGALTCVPVLRHHDYLLTFKYEKLRNALSDRLVADLLETHQNDAQASGGGPTVSPQRMRDWIMEVDTPSIVYALGIHPESAERFAGAADAIRTIHTEHPDSIAAAVQQLARAKVVLRDTKNEERAITAIANEFAVALRALPGDALFINQLSPLHTDGYVVYLRRVIEVDEDSVVLSPSRVPHDALYLRMSRLKSPYVYALSQQFGSVFSAIGLPSEYETARESTFERIKKMEDMN